jgi:putative transposase
MPLDCPIHWLGSAYDLIAFENLNIKGLAKTRLAQSILDVAWGAFLNIVQAVAVKCGKLAIAENPNGTSQKCSGCGELLQKTLTDRVHSCPHCGLVIDGDCNGAINILHRAQRTVGLGFAGGSSDPSPEKQQLSIVNLTSPRYSAA